MSSNAPLSGRPVASDHTPPVPVTDIVLNRAFTIANEAAFLWESRKFVVRSSAVTLEALARLDDRLSTLVRALSKRPGLADRLVEHEPASFPSGHAFVTALVALQSGAPDVFEQLAKRLESGAELHAPLASALAWPAYKDVRPYVERLLGSTAPSIVRLGIVAGVAHGANPGAPLGRALDAEDPLLRSTAFEAVGRLGAVGALPRVSAALGDADDTCRFWAAWSAVRLGDDAGIPVLGRFAADGGPFAAAACEMALRALTPEQAVRTHARLLSVTRNERLCILAAGIIGDPVLMPWLLERMRDPAHARAAGAAFCLMTGRDLRRDDLDTAPPAGTEAPTVVAADSADSGEGQESTSTGSQGELLADEADEELSWPDVARVCDWWEANLQSFISGGRYLAGKPVQHVNLAHVMRIGTQLQRAGAALEVALLKPSAPLVDVTAPAHQQASGQQA